MKINQTRNAVTAGMNKMEKVLKDEGLEQKDGFSRVLHQGISLDMEKIYFLLQ